MNKPAVPDAAPGRLGKHLHPLARNHARDQQDSLGSPRQAFAAVDQLLDGDIERLLDFWRFD
jgi:hypothetical protein